MYAHVFNIRYMKYFLYIEALLHRLVVWYLFVHAVSLFRKLLYITHNFTYLSILVVSTIL